MGRRWGKTTLGGAICVTSLVYGGGQIGWVAPIYKNARPLWRWSTRVLGPAIKNRLILANKTDRTLECYNGGLLTIFTADNIDSILGVGLDLVVIDEAARIDGEAWDRAIMPTLADRNGKAILISTPKGKNWFHTVWQMGQDPLNKDWFSTSAPSMDNPIPSIREAAQRARQYVSDRIYRQEWEAQFIADGGEVFRGIEAAATAPLQVEPIEGHRYVIGLDFGRYQDYTAAAVLDDDPSLDNVTMVDLQRFHGSDWHAQAERIAGLARYWNNAIVLGEKNSMGEPVLEMLVRLGVNISTFHTSNKTKPPLIEQLVSAIEWGNIRLQPDKVLLGELGAYTYKTLPSGYTQYHAPPGLHDDTVIALALAWRISRGGARVRVHTL